MTRGGQGTAGVSIEDARGVEAPGERRGGAGERGMVRPGLLLMAAVLTLAVVPQPGDGHAGEVATGRQVELGDNDFRISDMGTDGDTTRSAFEPAIAHNSVDDEYLVVWHGDDDFGTLADDEFEIFGQLLAGDGSEIGTDFRISSVGTDGDASIGAFSPDVAYDSTDNEYLVVWEGDDTTDVERQVFGQRVDATDGSLEGAQIDISAMGPPDTTEFVARDPAVAYSSTENEYLVVWDGDDDTLGADNEFEIFGQRLDATDGSLVGGNFRISHMGPDGNISFLADSVAIAYSAVQNEYLVVWSAEDDAGDLVDLEREIYGQRIDAASGNEAGSDDFRISDMGSDGAVTFDADDPAVDHDPVSDQYLVVWRGDDDTGLVVDNETEIWGQRIDGATGDELGENDFRISDMGPDGDQAFDGFAPAVAYQSAVNEYLVVWRGDDDTPPLVGNETEAFGQRIDAFGGEAGVNDFRVSDMGPDGQVAFSVGDVAVAASGPAAEYLIVWSGEEADAEFEVYGQRLLPDLLRFFIGDLSPFPLPAPGALELSPGRHPLPSS